MNTKEKTRHSWIFDAASEFTYCKLCGVIQTRNKHNINAICRGKVKVGLRNTMNTTKEIEEIIADNVFDRDLNDHCGGNGQDIIYQVNDSAKFKRDIQTLLEQREREAVEEYKTKVLSQALNEAAEKGYYDSVEFIESRAAYYELPDDLDNQENKEV